MKQESMNILVEYIYMKVIKDYNITDKKTMDILSDEALYFNDNISYLDGLSDNDLNEYIYKYLSMTAKNIKYFI